MENQLNTNQGLTPLSWLPKPEDSTISVDNSTQSVATSSENRRESVLRDASGKLIAGGPGLPGAGRPKGSGLVSDVIKEALRDGGAEKVKERLFGLMEAADRDSVSLAAIDSIMDRSEGKAIQNVRHAGVFMVLAPGEDVLNAAFGGSAPVENNE